MIMIYPVDTLHKLNTDKKAIKRLERHMSFLCTPNLERLPAG